MNPLSVGTRAPDFSLPLRVGEPPVTLSQHLGERNVVILFFPLAFSSVCTEELCQVQEDLEAWGSLDAAVLGISVDSIWVTQRFAAEHNLSFPVLSDFNKDVMTAYGVRNDNFFGMKGVANRSVFVVDREGTIIYSWMSLDAGVLPDFQAVKEALKSAQAPAAG